MIIEGDSNEVVKNDFGIDENKVWKPNSTASIMITGNNNNIGFSSPDTWSNTVYGSNSVCISISEGRGNEIKNNLIGTTAAGNMGRGNNQGIIRFHLTEKH